jgi:RNA polymerase sigma-70 factor (ECF subfamily)
MGTLSEYPSDEALVAQVDGRDTAAFATLYDRHSRMAFGLAYRLLNDPLAAEDAVQEAFLSLWRYAGTFQSQRSTARSWLLSIVHHRAIDQRRKTRSREVQSTAAVEEAEQIDHSIDIDHDVCVALEAVQVRNALATLPREQHQALALQYFGSLSHSEIARKLAIPLGTVKSRQRAALLKLRTILVGGERREGARCGLSTLWIIANPGTNEADEPGLSDLPLSGLPAPLQ